MSSGASRGCSGAARTWAHAPSRDAGRARTRASSEAPSSHDAERGRIGAWAPRSGDSSDLSDT